MKVAVVNTSAPFMRGGAEHLAESLVHELASRGHEVELVEVPSPLGDSQRGCRVNVRRCLFAYLRCGPCDRPKVPRLPCSTSQQIIWLLHQFRQVYDLWETSGRTFPPTTTTRG